MPHGGKEKPGPDGASIGPRPLSQERSYFHVFASLDLFRRLGRSSTRSSRSSSLGLLPGVDNKLLVIRGEAGRRTVGVRDGVGAGVLVDELAALAHVVVPVVAEALAVDVGEALVQRRVRLPDGAVVQGGHQAVAGQVRTNGLGGLREDVDARIAGLHD